jgi:hypothetical protein
MIRERFFIFTCRLETLVEFDPFSATCGPVYQFLT